jgi:hypothetical protein
MDDSGLTLWRGTRLLGTIHLRQPRTATWLTGVLLPAADGIALEGVRQRRVFIFPGHPVLQTPAAPETFGEPFTPRRPPDPEIALGFWEVRPGIPVGVPVNAQLSVRGASGHVVPFDAIVLREVRPAPGTGAHFSADIPAAAMRDGSIWLVSGTRVAGT